MKRPSMLSLALGAAIAVPAVATPAAGIVGADPGVLAALSSWSLSAVLGAIAWGIAKTRQHEAIIADFKARIGALEEADKVTGATLKSIDEKLNILIEHAADVADMRVRIRLPDDPDPKERKS